ncbi:hypothetical protein LJC02_02960 [Breznakia sp. OttesenSCG-928-G09]|nr:hypothetical protein [Breznakia sp. OttesenSCG-928-G09]
MKRLFSLMLLFGLVLSGCGSNEERPNPTNKLKEEGIKIELLEDTDTDTVAITINDYGDQFWLSSNDNGFNATLLPFGSYYDGIFLITENIYISGGCKYDFEKKEVLSDDDCSDDNLESAKLESELVNKFMEKHDLNIDDLKTIYEDTIK